MTIEHFRDNHYSSRGKVQVLQLAYFRILPLNYSEIGLKNVEVSNLHVYFLWKPTFLSLFVFMVMYWECYHPLYFFFCDIVLYLHWNLDLSTNIVPLPYPLFVPIK